ncbi:MAG: flagellar basal-body MS-ring/collar protein FliF [Gammaproteobacteria bacterium]|jgi:flagellar M-ring protein FliF|nr:flagellar basal-body MS-ring/collar protein FliF [Gammaproteobacteria bacterium]
MAMVKAESMALPARGFFALPLVRQLGLMAGLAASVALGMAMVLWAQQPDHRMLYANLNSQDSAAIVESLRKAGIDHSLADGTATVLVPADRVHEARLHLAGEGLPRGVGSGFELLDNQKGFGVSQFMENARYQRALEGELAMTIGSINAVRGARLHLAIPRQTAFARNQKRPSASVMLDLYPGRTLSEVQAAAISHLVAASIPNLDVDRVTIIDQHGRLLTPETGDQDLRLSATQFEYRRRVEESYIKRIEDILTPIMGPGAVKAQVNAELDFTVTEQTQETFSPEERVRSEQLVEENVSGGRLPMGVPGSLSNQPPGEGEQADDTAGAGSSSRRNVRNYELDKTISHSRMSGGVVRRLSAAVVIDHRTVVGDDGTPVRASLGEEEMERITALVREAVGFDAERGDSVNVVNAPFSLPTETGIETPEPSLTERFDFVGMAKQAAALVVVLFLVLGVLRPVLRDLAARGGRIPSPQALPAGAGQLADDQLTLGGPAATAALPKAAPSFEEKLDAIRGLVASDPKRVAQVVRNWVAAE